MNKILLSFSYFLLLLSTAKTQTPSWQWAVSAGSNKDDVARCITSDITRNAYVVGDFFSSTITFGATVLLNAGTTGNDIFFVKYDIFGNPLWAKSYGGSGSEYATAICADSLGFIYICGYFNSSQFIVGNDTLVNAGGKDIFILRYVNSGIFLWARRVGGSLDDYATDLSTDAFGTTYMTGNFKSASFIFGNDTLHNTGVAKAFILKYDKTGNARWARNPSGSTESHGSSTTPDFNGNVFLAGDYNSPLIIFGNDTLHNTGNYDIFLTKYDSSGTVQWARSAVGANSDYVSSVCTDQSNNVYLTGNYSSRPITFGTYTIYAWNSMYVVKYNDNGYVLWAKSYDGASAGISAYNPGKVYLGGSFETSTYFSTITLTSGSQYGSEIFVAGFDTTIGEQWAIKAGGFGDDYTTSLATNPSDDIYVCGTFNGSTAKFGSITLNNPDTPRNDIFVAKLDFSTEVNNALQINSPLSIYPNPVQGDQLFIELYVKNNSLAEITIYNSFGEKIKLEKIAATGKTRISFNVPPGIYFVVGNDGVQQWTSKIVKL